MENIVVLFEVKPTKAGMQNCLDLAAMLKPMLSGVEVGILWRDGRQFHIPYGIRLALGLPTKKLEEALRRLKNYVL